MPTPASAEIVHWVVSIVRECLGESTLHLKGFASRWSENFQAASSLASACGCFSRSSFRSAPPRTLAPLVPSAHASLPASASGSEVLKNGASGMLNLKSEWVGSHSSAPRFRHHVRASHHDSSPPCRLQSHRLKWNLFDDRPLFHLTRCLFRRPRVVMFRLSPKQTSFASP